jgi:hypothetical protein
MAKTQSSLDSIERRLDLLIQLMCLIIDPKKTPSISDQINMLAARGLSPSEIGRVVGREANYVSASLKSKRKAKKDAK